MRERKLDEVFEESLTAYLDEGRSVEDSLRLYPEFRGELEPLLRTALEVSNSFHSYSPPAAVRERGLARFLSDARGRAHLNGMRRESRRGWFAGLFAAPERTGLAAAGIAVAAVAIAVGIATTTGGGGDEPGDRVTAPTSTRGSSRDDAVPVTVLVLQDTIRTIRDRVSDNESVTPADVEALTNAVRQLKNDDSASPEDVEAAIQDLELSETLVVLVSVQPELAPQVEETREVAGIPGGGSLPTPIVEPGPTTAAGPADPPPPTVEPTPLPTAEPTPEPTPAPAAVPTEIPSPTDDARVPGFVPIN